MRGLTLDCKSCSCVFRGNHTVSESESLACETPRSEASAGTDDKLSVVLYSDNTLPCIESIDSPVEAIPVWLNGTEYRQSHATGQLEKGSRSSLCCVMLSTKALQASVDIIYVKAPRLLARNVLSFNLHLVRYNDHGLAAEK